MTFQSDMNGCWDILLIRDEKITAVKAAAKLLGATVKREVKPLAPEWEQWSKNLHQPGPAELTFKYQPKPNKRFEAWKAKQLAKLVTQMA